MTLRAAHAPLRIGLHGTLLLAMAALFLIFGPGRAMAAADPGVVVVKGTTFNYDVRVNLEDDLGSADVPVPGQPGVMGWSVREILLYAQAETDDAFVLSGLEKDPVLTREGKTNLSVNRNDVQKQSNDNRLPIYYLDGDTVLAVPGGGTTTYENSVPVIYVSRSTLEVEVDITSPNSTVRLRAGQKQTFKATASSSSGADVQLTWKIDGRDRQSGTAANNGTFTFEFSKEGTFQVQAFASVDGSSPVVDTVMVVVGKAKEPKKKKKKTKNEQPSKNTDDYTDPGYYPDYSYDDYYDDGSGPGAGSPNSGGTPSTPDRDEEPQEPPPADEPGETVTGQLIDPTQIATVVPPTETPGTATTQEAGPAEEDDGGGGGLSTGVKTALGIGALLGLGGLAEAGAFSGTVRRFRLRP